MTTLLFAFNFFREWHAERVKLIHCIYLQQMELTERAVAAQEKATEIAKVRLHCSFTTTLFIKYISTVGI